MVGTRTDLALEARPAGQSIPGVSEQTETLNGVTVTDIRVDSKDASDLLSKPIGRYITLDAPDIGKRSQEAFAHAAHLLASSLEKLMPNLGPMEEIMAVGLGNRMVTPDSLGPQTVEKLFVTRHIHAKARELAPKGMRPVSAIAPGVFGVTGLETAEVVRGLVEQTRPSRLILIDSLIALRLDRISTTIQLNDVGLLPGAGVGNRQPGLDAGSLGIPVIAIGVPTVVSAGTIVLETLSRFWPEQESRQQREKLEETVWKVTDELYGGMVVTPKDVDRMIADTASILSEGLNRMLHRPYFSEISLLLS